jgi:hypothetical protein
MVGAAVLAGLAPAAAAESPLRRARELIEKQLEFSEGIALLETALAKGSIAGKDLVAAHYLIAIAEIARGDETRSVAAFESMLALDPDVELDAMLAPKVHDAFRAASRAHQTWRPKLEELHTTALKSSVQVSLRLVDPKKIVQTIELRAGEKSKRIDATAAAIEAELALPSDRNKPVEISATALNAIGNIVARAKATAIVLTVAAPPKTSPEPEPEPEAPAWYGHWWIWAGLIVVAAAATVTTVALTRDDGDGVPTTRLP